MDDIDKVCNFLSLDSLKNLCPTVSTFSLPPFEITSGIIHYALWVLTVNPTCIQKWRWLYIFIVTSLQDLSEHL